MPLTKDDAYITFTKSHEGRFTTETTSIEEFYNAALPVLAPGGGRNYALVTINNGVTTKTNLDKRIHKLNLTTMVNGSRQLARLCPDDIKETIRNSLDSVLREALINMIDGIIFSDMTSTIII